MKDIFEKLTSYNIFNYLLPGVLFALLAKVCTRYDMTQESLVLGVFVYYFVGLVISRVGSLFLAPLIRLMMRTKPALYPDFIAATKADPKIEILSEANNMYRTIAAMGLLYFLLKGFEALSDRLPGLEDQAVNLGVAAIVGLFTLSYMKQSAYIAGRVAVAGKSDADLTG